MNLFGGEPHFQNPISRSSFTPGEASSLSTLSTLASLTQTSSPGLLGNSLGLLGNSPGLLGSGECKNQFFPNEL